MRFSRPFGSFQPKSSDMWYHLQVIDVHRYLMNTMTQISKLIVTNCVVVLSDLVYILTFIFFIIIIL